MSLDLDDIIAAAFSRAVTRRTLLQRTIRWTLGAGVAASTAWRLTGTARAQSCGIGQTNEFGCYCASTMGCGSGKCCFDTQNGCCNGATPRCTHWMTQPYCWCSITCCIGSHTGYYSCCDCWQSGTGGCGSANGRTACICGIRYLTGTC